MRTTKSKLTKEEQKLIAELVDSLVTCEDFTLATDFAEDAYALFKEEISKRRQFKSFWQLFYGIKKLYTKYQVGDLIKNVDFYNNVRAFFRSFITSGFFRELDKLDPMEALEIFLRAFQPKPQQPQGGSGGDGKQEEQQGDGQGEGEGEGKEGEGEGEGEDKEPKQSPSGKSEDQKGMSGDNKSLPIDMTKFKQSLPKIEKAIDGGIFDKEDVQDYLSQSAGMDHKDIHVGNIVEIMEKVANNLTDRELDIFYLARRKEAIEKYRRDEVLEDVQFPDNEMTIKNIQNTEELLKILPAQYAQDDDIFFQKLLKKELLIRQYQSRRLKKQALYLLIDVSGSMSNSGKQDVYASAVGVALVRQAVDEGSIYFLRFFDYSPHKLHRITTKKEALKMVDTLLRKPYSGGGTSIQNAIKKAVEDITADPVKFEKAEIMVITDGQDQVNLYKNDLKDIKLHSTIIMGENPGLESISDTYTVLEQKDFS